MNLFLFYEEEKETWRIFQDMFKRVWEPKGECIHLLCGVGLAELAWWRAKGRFLSKCQSEGKFKNSVTNQKFNIIFPLIVWFVSFGVSLVVPPFSPSLFFSKRSLCGIEFLRYSMHINIREELCYIELLHTFEWKNRNLEVVGRRGWWGRRADFSKPQVDVAVIDSMSLFSCWLWPRMGKY